MPYIKKTLLLVSMAKNEIGKLMLCRDLSYQISIEFALQFDTHTQKSVYDFLCCRLSFTVEFC